MKCQMSAVEPAEDDGDNGFAASGSELPRSGTVIYINENPTQAPRNVGVPLDAIRRAGVEEVVDIPFLVEMLRL